jgi:hypothetical protein
MVYMITGQLGLGSLIYTSISTKKGLRAIPCKITRRTNRSFWFSPTREWSHICGEFPYPINIVTGKSKYDYYTSQIEADKANYDQNEREKMVKKKRLIASRFALWDIDPEVGYS